MEKEIEFDNQRPDEEVIILAHQHPWVWAKTAFWLVILAVIAFLAFLVWHVNAISLIILGIVLVLAAIIIFFKAFTYQNTFFILTNERIIYIKQLSIFGRRVQETGLSESCNFSYELNGFIKNIFNYGDLRINTQGDSVDSIILENFENPHFIHEKLSHLHNAASKNQED